MLSAFYEHSHLFGLAWTQMPLKTLKGAVSFVFFHFSQGSLVIFVEVL